VYIFAGFSVASFIIFFPGFITRIKDQEQDIGLRLAIGLTIAVALSILFRTVNASADISQYRWGQIIGWILGIIATLKLLGMFFKTKEESKPSIEKEEKKEKANFGKILGLTIGLFSIFIVIWFAFMSPTVISRWTEGDYVGIIIGLLVMFAITITVMIWKPDILSSIKSWALWIWNGVFALSLTLSVLAHQLRFPDDPSVYPIIAPTTAWYHQIGLVIMIISSPIIFIDFMLLTRELIRIKPKPMKMGGSFTLGGLFIIIMLFVQILPNVWGYLPPISYGFRDKYWLAFFIPGLLITLAILLVKKETIKLEHITKDLKPKILITSIFGIIFIATIVGGFIATPRPNYSAQGKTSLVILTYNIQQGVNVSGDRNYDGQLELIRQLDPDIIGLQECDPTRISGGNLDVVRYFAERLNMYSYYGPKTVTNTYGCAILSKFPISNAYSFFMSSDQEQIGSAQAQITVGTTTFNVAVHHPAGDSGQIRVDQNLEMLTQVEGLSNVIFMGDFNYKPYTQMYNDTLSAGLVDSYGVMYGIPALDNIDHIFLSSGATVLDAQYIEEGQSDHPAYWIEIQL